MLYFLYRNVVLNVAELRCNKIVVFKIQSTALNEAVRVWPPDLTVKPGTKIWLDQSWPLVSAPPCFILLLVLEKQLQELETAMLASILDMTEYKKGYSSSTSSSSCQLSSPLEWTDGLLLIHSCPPPLDQHLLRLLGWSAVRHLSQHLLFLPCFSNHGPLNLKSIPVGETQSGAKQPQK